MISIATVSFMTIQEQEVFREYLRSIEDELLEAVAADYMWLAAQEGEEKFEARFDWRRRACREECARRGKLRLWQRAERTIFDPLGNAA
jgi:hypothetical protein